MRLPLIPLAATGVAISATLLTLASCGSSSSSSNNNTNTSTAFDINSIQHVVVIYQENWSFDAQYSQFPGANGVAFGTAVTQTTTSGSAITALPSPVNENDQVDTANFPAWNASQPVAFYNLLGSFFETAPDAISTSTITGDLVHRFYIEQWQIDGGQNDRFVAWTDNPGLTLSGYDATQLPLGQLAAKYVLCDEFFHSAFGGSFLNHQYLISAQAPIYCPSTSTPAMENAIVATQLSGAPAFITTSTTTGMGVPSISPSQATLEANASTPLPTLGVDWPSAVTPGNVGAASPIQDGQLLSTTDAAAANLGNGSYYCINTMYPASWPFPVTNSGGQLIPSGKFVPLQTHKTIGDLLSSANVTWKWYSEGWNDAVAGNPDPNFQYHHQAFNYYAQFKPGTTGRTHLQDTTDLDNDLATNTLPAVSFVKFLGENNEHPGYTNIITGQQRVANLVTQIQNSPAWASTVIFITYDEHGGRWDHVNPLTYPNADAWGPGVRVPCLVISPYAKASYVDHTPMETVSILSFIEKRWSLGTIPGATRDANAVPFTNSFTGNPVLTRKFQ